jgi:hypothetical protein
MSTRMPAQAGASPAWAGIRVDMRRMLKITPP